MPFLQPYVVSRNQARYKTIDVCDDFILQEHRYSLRKSRHFFWARIITRSTRPRLKVAESSSVEAIREREWQYISRDLAAGMPSALRLLPTGSEERTSWLLEKILRVKRCLGDADDDEEEDGDGDCEGEEFEDDGDDDLEDFADAEDEDDDEVDGGAELERGIGASHSVASSVGSTMSLSSSSSSSSSLSSSSRSLQPTSSSAGIKSPGMASRFNLVRHLRTRKPDSERFLERSVGLIHPDSDAAADRDASSPATAGVIVGGAPASPAAAAASSFRQAASPPPSTPLASPRTPSRSRALRHRRSQSAPRSRSAGPGPGPGPKGAGLDDPDTDTDAEGATASTSVFGAGSMLPVPGAGPTRPKSARNATLLSAGWMRSSLSGMLGSEASNTGKPGLKSGKPAPWAAPVMLDGEALPAYLTSAPCAVKPDKKDKDKDKDKEVVTMEKLKKEHERRLMALAVAGATTASVVMRVVSFDAFLLLLIGANILACYVVQHRHFFVKKMAKSSIKRRVKFTKTVWASRWTKGGGASKADDAGKAVDAGKADDASGSASGSASAGQWTAGETEQQGGSQAAGAGTASGGPGRGPGAAPSLATPRRTLSQPPTPTKPAFFGPESPARSTSFIAEGDGDGDGDGAPQAAGAGASATASPSPGVLSRQSSASRLLKKMTAAAIAPASPPRVPAKSDGHHRS